VIRKDSNRNPTLVEFPQLLTVVLNQKRDDAAPMINETISVYDIERIALSVSDDSQPDEDIPELIGMYLENTAGCESLSQDEIEHLIITIESKVNEIQRTTKGDQ
jgi:hypothetical protein